MASKILEVMSRDAQQDSAVSVQNAVHEILKPQQELVNTNLPAELQHFGMRTVAVKCQAQWRSAAQSGGGKMIEEHGGIERLQTAADENYSEQVQTQTCKIF